MMSPDEKELKQLQKQCARSLALYTDLAEAVCEILTQSPMAPLSPGDRSRIRNLHRAELVALKNYLAARVRLMTALSLETYPQFRNLHDAITADRTQSSARA
jgi:hypothetical protein